MEDRIRPYVLSIGGHDPSGGAGISSDLKTMEAIGVQGMSVCTSLTFQTEDNFIGLKWVGKKDLKRQLKPILEQYDISVVKIGVIENLDILKWIVKSLKEFDDHIFIIWDPVLVSSSGFKLYKSLKSKKVKEVLQYIDLVTPNWFEVKELTGEKHSMIAAKKLSKYTSVYLKGGHHESNIGQDYLFSEGAEMIFVPEYISNYEKHGSGCVFSSALASYLALNFAIDSACVATKRYVAEFLDSTEGLLGVHYNSL